MATKRTKAISTKAALVSRLRDAAVLEQQFMCQYLYAALSLKKSPDAACSDAQFERVRRWAQTLYMIARQEMEHLSIINSILTAVGAQPCFVHPAFPTRSRFFTHASLRAKHAAEPPPTQEPCEIPFVLEPFTLRAARRFTCMESPALKDLSGPERADVLRWGFHPPSRGCNTIVPPKLPLEASAKDVEVGTIQQLYRELILGIRLLQENLGEAVLFSGHESGQDEVISEYQVYLTRIDDADSAVAALQLVVQQGEGLDAPPGYDSHFLNYHQIATEYAALVKESPGFEPFKDVPLNPSVNGFANPAAKAAASLFNLGYVTLLYMLTGYFGLFERGSFNKTQPYLTAALEFNSFSPMMTMFVRTLGEILTELPAASPDDGTRAAPVFDIPAADLAQLAVAPAIGNFYGQAPFYAKRLGALVTGLADLGAMPGLPPPVRTRLAFMHQNISRLARNFGYIDEHGLYWAPNAPEAA